MTPVQSGIPRRVMPSQTLQSFLEQHAPGSIRAKLILAFLTVTLFSSSVIVVVSDVLLRERLMSDVGERIHDSATTSGLMIGDLLEQETDKLHSFGLNKIVQDTVAATNRTYPDEAEARVRIAAIDQGWRSGADDTTFRARQNNLVAAELREYQATFPDNLEVFVTDRYGAIVATATRTADYDQSDEAWWQATWNNGLGAVYLGQPAFDESSSAATIVIAVPLYDPNNATVIGVLRSTYQLQGIVKRLDRARLGRTGQLEIVLPDHRFLNSQVIPTDLTAGEGSQLPQHAELFRTTPVHGVRRVVSSAPVASGTDDVAVGALGWSVIAYQDHGEVLEVVNSATQTTLLLALGALVAAGGLAILIARTLSQPIHQLAGAAQQIAGGEFQHRIAMSQKDEIGVLATRFNQMASTVEQRTNELEVQYRQAEAARQEAERAYAQIATHLSTIEQQQAVIREMSVPLLPVSSSTLVLPLIGALDTARLQLVLDHALQTLERTKARSLIVDITAVPVIDTQVAAGLLSLIGGARLLGTEVVLVGIRPEVAQSIVGLGIDLTSVVTRSSLQGGIAYAMGR